LSLGEILIESGHLPGGWLSQQAETAFQLNSLILCAAAYLRLAASANESDVGDYRQRAQRCIDSLLEAESPIGWTNESRVRDFDKAYRMLGRALLENHQALLGNKDITPGHRRLLDSQLQTTVINLADPAPLSRMIKGVGLLQSLMWPSTDIGRMYSDAVATIASLPYEIHNIGPLLRESFVANDRSLLPAAAPIVVAAALSRILSPEDRIVAVVLKIPNSSGPGLKGDVDLLLNVKQSSKSGLAPGLHVLEVKYQNAFRALMDQNTRELRRAHEQLTVSEAKFRELGFPVRKGIILFTSVRGDGNIEVVKDRLFGTDFYRINCAHRSGRLTLSDNVFKVVFAHESVLTEVVTKLRRSPA